MSFQPGATVYTQGFGSRPENIEVPHIDVRAPASTDIQYPVGKRWLNKTTGYEYVNGYFSTSNGVTSANWTLLGAGGAFTQFTTDDSNIVTPSSGNINLAGSGSTTTVGSGSTATVELTGLTNHAVLVGAGTSTITKLAVGTNGQVLLGSTGADPAFGTLTSTTGLSFTGGAGSLALNVKQGGFAVNSISGTSGNLAVQNAYVLNNASQTTMTLPATASVGDMILITGGTANTAGWIIAQNAGQTIHQANLASTTGATGTATSAAHECESVLLMCITVNTDFVILYSNGTVTLA